MKTILTGLDLIPSTSKLDGLLLSTDKPRAKHASKPHKTKELQVKIFEPEPSTAKKIISLPRFCPLPCVRSSKNLDLPSGFGLVSMGRYGEVWCKNDGQVAIVRRLNSQVHFYGSDSLNKINAYLTEVVNRGLSLVQATDIVCNELS
jgi:hypothetical protein